LTFNLLEQFLRGNDLARKKLLEYLLAHEEIADLEVLSASARF
jgi:hypothetical protein